jgi:hypothetical protein
MANPFKSPILGMIALLALAATASAQNPQGVAQHPPNRAEKLAADDPGGPAPVRDLSGSYVGPTESKLGMDVAPMTDLGKKLFAMNKPDPFSAGSNDPWATCDPFGMPRSADNETRGIAFAQMPGRVVILNQYQKVWREVWTDGRALPKNVGIADGPDPRWYGYSVGHWDGDNTLVVETTGMNASSWVDRRGYPHSVNAHVEERYTRPNHNNIDLTVTLDDPKMYTKPWVVATNHFKWIPDQADEEQVCVPSEALLYLKAVAGPADEDQATGKKK